MRKSTVAGLAAAAAALAAPAAASAASLAVDPPKGCYREGETVFLTGSGYTPNTVVKFTRAGVLVPTTSPVMADPAGKIVGATLSLPGLESGQLRLTYVGTDAANASNAAHIRLLVSAIDVTLKPEKKGAPNRLLTISGRGFTTGKTLWVHIRPKRRKGPVRTLKIGPLKGACRTLSVKRRLFPASAAPGVYHAQFDTYPSYNPARAVAAGYDITVYRTAHHASVSWAGR